MKPNLSISISTVASLGDKLNPFIRQLLGTETRFRFTDVGNEVFADKQMFVVTKEFIYCPYALPMVEHEIAHAVEMKDKSRWTVPDWGLRFDDFVHDKPMTASRFFASMAREQRARAIQLHMMPASYLVNDTSNTLMSLLNNKHAWGGNSTKKRLPYGRFKTYQDVETWIQDIREKTYKAWSLERIEHEWKIRLEHMQNWMESK